MEGAIPMADALARKGSSFHTPLSVLVPAQDGALADNLFRVCDERLGLWTIRVPSVSASVSAMQIVFISLIIIAPEIPANQVSELLARVWQWRSEAPVLLLGNEAAEIHAGWQSRRMAVLRCPLAPGLLSRAVDVALQPAQTRRDRTRMS